MYDLTFLVGALFPTLVLSRAALWFFARYVPRGPWLALLANAISLLICGSVYGLLEQPVVVLRGQLSYAFAQLVWLIVDLARYLFSKPRNSN